MSLNKPLLAETALYVAWTQALVAMMGSLTFSELLHYPPCVLCWYQRICMYPLVLILGIGILRKEKTAWLYALPLAAIGWLISIYHNLLYFKLVPEANAPCLQGVSCTTKFIEYFGFITIPFLSLTAFSLILISLGMYLKWRTDV